MNINKSQLLLKSSEAGESGGQKSCQLRNYYVYIGICIHIRRALLLLFI